MNPDRDIDTLARTVYGEARNQGLLGMEAVASVVMNRLAVSNYKGGFWWGNCVSDICRWPFQFSCWDYNDPNRPKLLAVTPDDKFFAVALSIAEKAIDGKLEDITFSATHYHTLKAHASWDQGAIPTVTIRDHVFYRPAEVPAIPQAAA